MIDIILNTVFSIQYLMVGVLVAALLDIGIYYTKSSSRFTFVEILGCIMFWPLAVLYFLIAFFKQDN